MSVSVHQTLTSKANSCYVYTYTVISSLGSLRWGRFCHCAGTRWRKGWDSTGGPKCSRLLVMGVSNKVSSFLIKILLLLFVSFTFASSSILGEKVLRLGKGGCRVPWSAFLLVAAASKFEPGFLDVPDTSFHLHPHWVMANSWEKLMTVPYFYCFSFASLLSCDNCWLLFCLFAMLTSRLRTLYGCI